MNKCRSDYLCLVHIIKNIDRFYIFTPTREMKLLNREDFISIDRPVVFSYFSQNTYMSFSNLYIKYDSIGKFDFITQNLLDNRRRIM